MDTRFSVVIPTFNRPAVLERALLALSNSRFPRSAVEVIVVDDGGTAPLGAIISRFAGQLDIRLVRQENGGPAKARNAGAEAARHEFLAFTDDDCEPAPGWLPALARRIERSPECLVGGRTVNGLAGNPYSAAHQTVVAMVYAFYNGDPARPRFFATNNIAVSKDLFLACGGFDEAFRVSEDREFCNRWRHCGRALTHEPEAVVEHCHPLTLVDFCKLHFRYGRGAPLFHEACAARDSGNLADHAGFYRSLPRLWRSTREERLGLNTLPLLLLLAAWRAANAAGFFYETLARTVPRPAPARNAERLSR